MELWGPSAGSREPEAGVDSGDSAAGCRLPALDSGFTLVGVVIGIAIITILLAAVAPSISMLLERDREQELIFRGKQYARAILIFQRRYGRLPNELKELSAMKPRSVRQLWKDPMCNCGDWETIIAGTAEASPMGQPPPPGGTGLQTPGTPRATRTSSASSGFGDDTQPTPAFLGGTGTVQLTPTPTSIFGQTGKKTGPIVGVRTKVHRKGIKQWRGRDYTDEWRFIAGDADNDVVSIDPNAFKNPASAGGATPSSPK